MHSERQFPLSQMINKTEPTFTDLLMAIELATNDIELNVSKLMEDKYIPNTNQVVTTPKNEDATKRMELHDELSKIDEETETIIKKYHQRMKRLESPISVLEEESQKNELSEKQLMSFLYNQKKKAEQEAKVLENRMRMLERSEQRMNLKIKKTEIKADKVDRVRKLNRDHKDALEKKEQQRY